MPIVAGRVVTDTQGVWLAGGEGRGPRRVVRAACSLARTCSCGAIALHRTCGLWLRFVSVPHRACGTITRYTTRVAGPCLISCACAYS